MREDGQQLFFNCRTSQLQLSGHSQQIDDIGLAFERTWIGLHEAMIDCNLADPIEFVFANADVGQATRQPYSPNEF